MNLRIAPLVFALLLSIGGCPGDGPSGSEVDGSAIDVEPADDLDGDSSGLDSDAGDDPDEGDAADGLEDIAPNPDADDADGEGDAFDGAPAPGTFGAPCNNNDACLSGWCIEGPKGDVCTRLCDLDCPGGYDCKAIIVSGDPVSLCVPIQKALCTPCTDDVQCSYGACLGEGDARRCAYGCAEDDECPNGFSCVGATDETKEGLYCQPDTGACECNAMADGGSRTCTLSNDMGTCYGIETCDPSVGWDLCTANAPGAEVCDGVDNDCNFKIDDTLASGEACEVSVEGVGICGGVNTCAGAAGWVCSAGTPSDESCNFIDDDCDGETDEPFRAADGSWTLPEHCGVCGNDCAGLFANATSTCALIDGAPQCVVETCDSGTYPSSPYSCAPLVESLCAPCSSDASCPGPGNLCLVFEDGSFCGRECGPDSPYDTPCPDGFSCVTQGDGAMQCAPSTGACDCLPDDIGDEKTCSASGELGICYGLRTCGESGWSPCGAIPPTGEVCDGVDNDCDGSIDEGVVEPEEACANANEFGVCAGVWACKGTDKWACGAGLPAEEACNYIDDNCDGSTDEAFQNEAGLYTDDAHCGLCNVGCEGAILFATESECAVVDGASVCIALGCEEGYILPSGTNQICVPASGGVDCAPCSEDTHCSAIYGGLCEVLDGVQVCTSGCDIEHPCGDALACDEGRCRPPSGSCTCFEANQGELRACFESNGFGTCSGTQLCDATDGWSLCTAGSPGAEVCNGTDDDCDGLLDEGVTPPPGACAVANDAGTCSGAWICGDSGAGSVEWWCNASTPNLETCNYADDDCDGAVDEPFRAEGGGPYNADDHCGACNLGCDGAIPNAISGCVTAGDKASCQVIACDEGFYKAGTLTCLPATGAACEPCVVDANCPTPGDLCLALDGGAFCGLDCSASNLHGTAPGACPSGFSCMDIGGGEQCVPVSGSCACLPGDEEAVRACLETNTTGTCYGQESCDPTLGWTECSADTPSLEVCNGVDDDCDAVPDDVPGRGAACANANEFGSCAGIQDCISGGPETLVCVGPTPAEEICNGTDDNCDGAADETFPDKNTVCLTGDGACARPGVKVCNAAGDATECDAVAGPSSGETCNLIDDDCDGETDETFKTDGVYAGVTACGNCFTNCTEVFAKPNGFGACEADEGAPTCALKCCGIGSTEPGCDGTTAAFDLNGVPDDGCEFILDPTAIYASESEPGSEDSTSCGLAPAAVPGNHSCKTITHAIDRAKSIGRIKVLVAGGAYDEVVTVQAGVSLYGGHNPTTWTNDIDANLTAIFGTFGSGHRRTLIAHDIVGTATSVDGFVIYGQAATGYGENSYAVSVRGSTDALTLRNNTIWAGSGGPGASGSPGTPGSSGGHGLTGLDAYEPAAQFLCHADCVDSGAANAGGFGGVGICNATDVSGGAGGTADCPDYQEGADLCGSCTTAGSSSQTVTTSGSTGPNSGGGGGLGGCDSLMDGGCLGSCVCQNPPAGACPQGNTGQIGSNGSDGVHGGFGGGCTDGTGGVAGGEWTPASAGTGAVGSNGRGGGGGGASGGVETYFDSGCAGNGWTDIAGSGGGGGAGGCGGTGGTQGGGGGGAFALFVVLEGAAAASPPQITDNSLFMGVGGAGGTGGSGGTAGAGGNGGPGGDGGSAASTLWCASAGGKGGEGGRGGHGGGAGGGCGGASFGLYVSASAGPGVASWVTQNDLFAGGMGGAAGSGGASGPGGQPGTPGTAGTSLPSNL